MSLAVRRFSLSLIVTIGVATLTAIGGHAGAETRAAAADRLPPELRASGQLRLGTSPTYAPLEYKDPATNVLMGLDIDLGNMIAERLGLKPVWVEQSFEQLIPSLDTSRIDVGASGMTDIPSRRDKTDFVDYFATGVQLFTLAPAPDGMKVPTDLCGKKVAVNRNGIFFIRAREFSAKACETAGRPPLDLSLTDRTADSRLQLVQGRVAAAGQGVDSIRYLNESPTSADRGKYALIGTPISVDLAGFGVAKSHPELRNAIATVLKEMIADGSYAAIFKKWEMPYTQVRTVTINGDAAGTK
jgi:polar amino acid transport system substrate-binding protein